MAAPEQLPGPLCVKQRDPMREIHVTRRRTVLTALAAFAMAGFAVGAHPALAQDDPLPSWNDTPAKQAILDFVHAATDRTSPKFVRPEERIATFDQDGTLWVEHPMYTQVVYCLERVPAVVEKNPKLEECRALQDRAFGQS